MFLSPFVAKELCHKHLNPMKDVDQVKCSNMRKKSFLDVCKKHSILSKPTLMASGNLFHRFPLFKVLIFNFYNNKTVFIGGL